MDWKDRFYWKDWFFNIIGRAAVTITFWMTVLATFLLMILLLDIVTGGAYDTILVVMLICAVATAIGFLVTGRE